MTSTPQLIASPPDVQPDDAAATAVSRDVVVAGNLQRDLFRLGVVPCVIVALALTGWFTHSRLDALEAAFDAEGQAVARQVAVFDNHPRVGFVYSAYAMVDERSRPFA